MRGRGPNEKTAKTIQDSDLAPFNSPSLFNSIGLAFLFASSIGLVLFSLDLWYWFSVLRRIEQNSSVLL